jgi:hypothetical protein
MGPVTYVRCANEPARSDEGHGAEHVRMVRRECHGNGAAKRKPHEMESRGSRPGERGRGENSEHLEGVKAGIVFEITG